MAKEKPDIDALVQEVCKKGCPVSLIENEQALEFIHKLELQEDIGKPPNRAKTAKLLKELWGIEVSRRALSSHFTGECKCRKKKETTV